MSVFWKKIEFFFIREKAILLAFCSREQNPGELSGGKVPNIFDFLITLRGLNGFQWNFKNYIYDLRSYASHTQAVFPGYYTNSWPSLIPHSWSTGITERYLPLQYTLARRYQALTNRIHMLVTYLKS